MEWRAFVDGSYESQSATFDQEDTINFYFEPREVEGATSKYALYPTPGSKSLVTAAGVPGRAHIAIRDRGNPREFAVIGTALYEVDASANLTSLGAVASNGQPATLSWNGDGGHELFITAGGNGYLYDLVSGVFSTIANLAGVADKGAATGGYFFALDISTSTIYASGLLDGTTWLGTSIAQRSAAPDPWISILAANNYLYAFGTETSEVWFNAGLSPFPFQLHPSGLIQFGCVASFSPAVVDSAVLWLGQTNQGYGMVLRVYGFQPEVISTFPLQKAVNGYSIVSDALGDVYNDVGHTFYQLSFQEAGVTWLYDFQSEKWTKKLTWISEENRWDISRPIWHAFVFGQHRWLDVVSGNLYKVSQDYATDVENRPLRRLRRAPCLEAENQYVHYSYFELDLEPGLGTATGQGEDPQVMMRLSNDAGKTWSNERQCSAGKIGEYSTRVRWDRFGTGRRRVVEVTISDPVPYRISNAYIGLRQPVNV